MNAAGAQLLDLDIGGAVEKLKEVIRDMVEGGDI